MFIVLLKFSNKRDHADDFADAHMKWVKKGFDDGIFLLAGSIKPGLGGAILAFSTSLSDLKKRVNADPFVTGKIVTAEILEIEPGKANERLAFLVED
ncbi:MAG: hypothetical protein AABZ55_02315 [Bdellovibrionota bacterium]